MAIRITVIAMSVAIIALCFARHVAAGVSSSTGAIEIVPAPPDARCDRFTDPTRISVWNERQSIILDTSLDAFRADPGLYDELGDFFPVVLNPGTRLSSHAVHLDSPDPNGTEATGTVTFDTEIIAVIPHGDGRQVIDRSDFLGPLGTRMPNGLNDRGLEFRHVDFFEIGADRRTIRTRLRVSECIDFMRVITRSQHQCIADQDNGTGTGQPDGGVTIDDLLYFLSSFAAGMRRADVDDGSATGTPDGGVTIDDLLYFLQRFEEGC